MEILQFLSGGFDILFTDLRSFRRNLLTKMAHYNYRLRAESGSSTSKKLRILQKKRTLKRGGLGAPWRSLGPRRGHPGMWQVHTDDISRYKSRKPKKRTLLPKREHCYQKENIVPDHQSRQGPSGGRAKI